MGKVLCKFDHRIKTSVSAHEVLGSIIGPVKSDTVTHSSSPLRRFCVAQALYRRDRIVTCFGAILRVRERNEDLILMVQRIADVLSLLNP